MFAVDAGAAEVPQPSQVAVVVSAPQRVHARRVREDRVPVEVRVGRGSDGRESQGEEREEVHVEVSRWRRSERAVRQYERERGDIIIIIIIIFFFFFFFFFLLLDVVVDGDL